MRHVGCTGSRNGVTDPQRESVGRVLQRLFVPDAILHHGDCVGADEAIARMGRSVGFRLHSHPPLSPQFRAYVPSDLYSPPEGFLSRDWSIAASVRVLVAAPAGPERLRSGTWATVRYARQLCVPVVFVWSDGQLTYELSEPCAR